MISYIDVCEAIEDLSKSKPWETYNLVYIWEQRLKENPIVRQKLQDERDAWDERLEEDPDHNSDTDRLVRQDRD